MVNKYHSIAVKDGGVLDGLNTFLKGLLENGFVSALLVPKMLPSGDGYVQTLILDPTQVQKVNPCAPTLPVHSARILSELTSGQIKGRIGALLKPCELKAVVELVKFLQIDLDNVVTIGIDCPGTYEVRDFAVLAKNGGISQSLLIEGLQKGEQQPPEGYALRRSCQICENPAAVNADINLGLLGCDLSREIEVAVGERFREELAEGGSLKLADKGSAGRPGAIKKLTARRRKKREEVLKQVRDSTGSLEKLMQVLSTCIRCHNCMNACPICYCKECVFESNVFEHTSDQFLSWAARKGALRLPTDTLLFHLTRMSHMATSCTSCGLCSSACPNQLPVSDLFGLIGGELQEMFAYGAGRALEEQPPVIVFKEDELQAETGS
ncbi:MAG: 4Fe-4S dicluster domain-containing protein [Spirochaetaceae bacterium]|nr:MAG: 4Fe-4S dicluster domain-containing protein [Spirochaetaceae bacterium]